MPAAIAILWGATLGWLNGGSLKRLNHSDLRWPYVLLVVFLLQGYLRGRIGNHGSFTWGLLGWATASLLLVCLLAFQPKRSMLVLIALGMSANMLVVLLNGHMPILLQTDGSASAAPLADGFYDALTSATIAPLLGDCLLLPLFGATYVLSIGDVLLLTGAVGFMVQRMTTCEGESVV